MKSRYAEAKEFPLSDMRPTNKYAAKNIPDRWGQYRELAEGLYFI